MSDGRFRHALVVLALLAGALMLSLPATPAAGQDPPPADGGGQGGGGDQGGADGAQQDGEGPTDDGAGDGQADGAGADAADDGDEADDDGSGDDSDVIQWVIIGIVAIVALLVIGAVASSLGRRNDQAQDRRDQQRLARHERLSRIVGGGQWVHDQVSLEMLNPSVDPERLQQNWQDMRRRIYDLGSEAAALAVDSDPQTASSLRDLSRTLGSVVGAIDTNVGLRSTSDQNDPGAQNALAASNDAVQARRAELAAVLTSLQQLG